MQPCIQVTQFYNRGDSRSKPPAYARWFLISSAGKQIASRSSESVEEAEVAAKLAAEERGLTDLPIYYRSGVFLGRF